MAAEIKSQQVAQQLEGAHKQASERLTKQLTTVQQALAAAEADARRAAAERDALMASSQKELEEARRRNEAAQVGALGGTASSHSSSAVFGPGL